jgi:hypothetical protein
MDEKYYSVAAYQSKEIGAQPIVANPSEPATNRSKVRREKREFEIVHHNLNV